MAIIKPFACIRPEAGKADKVAALPYDVFNREEAKREVEREPLSFLKIDRAETQFADTVDAYAPCVYEKAKELFQQMITEKIFLIDENPGYYLYELTMEKRSQTGLVACASIDDYQNGVIKKHENTREEKEQDRIRHVDALNAQTGPIFLAYRANDKLREMIAEEKKKRTIYSFTATDGVMHKVWKIEEKEKVLDIESTFAAIQELYIADGHHRAASAVKVGLMRRERSLNQQGEEAFQYFLSVLFPDEELHIMDYNRAVRDLNGYTKEEFLERVSQFFQITPKGEVPYKPREKATFGMYVDSSWYALEAKEELKQITDTVEALDVSLLQNYLLEPILGIKDPRTDKRIDFIGGIRGLSELEKRVEEDMQVAFALYPTSIEELFAVADANQLMPPKSTWFEPKLRSGLFIHSLED